MKNSAAIAIVYEDILFFNKNKDYGAYVIRRSYMRNLTFAILTAVFIFTAATSFPLFTKSGKNVALPRIIIDRTIILDDVNSDVDKNRIPKVEPPTIIRSTIKFLPPKVVEDEKVAPEEKIPTQDEIKNVAIGTITQKGTDTGPDLTDPIIQDVEKVLPEIKENVFTWVEEMPRYKSDESEIYKFFAQNIKYPEIARRAGIEGRVTLGFIVANDGSITNISVLKGIGGGCDEEAVRVLGLMGKWSPGRQNGNPVRVVMSIPILFKLQ